MFYLFYLFSIAMLVYQRATSYHLQRLFFPARQTWSHLDEMRTVKFDAGNHGFWSYQLSNWKTLQTYQNYCVYIIVHDIHIYIYIYGCIWFYTYIYIILFETSENIHVQVHPCKMSQLLTVHPKRRSSTLSERSPASVWGIPPGTLQWTNLAVSELKVWWDRPWTMLNWYWVISCVIIRCLQKMGGVWRSMEKWGPRLSWLIKMLHLQ